MKLLTIVLPTYNTERYLKRCLDSLLLNSDYKLLEIIAVNDGSKDNSLKILQEYEEKYPETVIVLDKENGGHGSTINEGLRIASGKYFRVIDTDDWVDIQNFPLFLNCLKDKNSDLIITNFSREHVYSGETQSIKYSNIEYNKVYNFDTFDFSLIGEEYFYMSTSTYKTELLREANLHLQEKTFYVDMEYNTQPIPYVKTFEFLDLDIYKYFIGRADQSMNLKSFASHYLDHERVMKGLIEKYLKEQKTLCNPNAQKYIEKILFYMLYTNYNIQAIYNENRNDAVKILRTFDKYLRKTDIGLYNMMRCSYVITILRRLKFIPVLLFNGDYLLKILGIIDRIHLKFNKLFRNK